MSETLVCGGMNMNNVYYVYEWIRLDTNEPFYVGKGKGNRWRSFNRKYNPYFMRVINNVDVAVNILENNLSEQAALEYEVYYIEYYKDLGYELTNLTPGGDNPPIVHLTGKRNGMYGRFLNDNPFYGKKHTNETRRRMSESHKNCIPWNKGKSVGNNRTPKKIYCLTTNELFNNIHEITCKYNVNKSAVYAACNNSRHYVGISKDNLPLIWAWYDEYIKITDSEKQEKLSKGYKNVIVCITTNERFFTLKEGAKKYGITSTCIYNNLEGKSNCAGHSLDGEKLVWKRYYNIMEIQE